MSIDKEVDFYSTRFIDKQINNEQDLLDILGKMFPKRKLLVFQESLNPLFFDLSSGVAGSILQKLINYQVRTAFVINLGSIKSEKFHALINEANVGIEFRFFEDKDEAIAWLNL